MKADISSCSIGLIIVLFFLGMIVQERVFADSALLSESTYKRLSTIHELMGEEKYDDALKRLNVLADTVSSRKYEKAVVMQTYGYLYVSTDQPRKAIAAFNQSLESQAMPEPAEQNVRLNLAQLYMSVGEAHKAVNIYEAWIKLEKSPSPAGYALGGMLYAEVKNYALAAKYLKSAIAASEVPREDWYRLLLAIYYEDKKYSQAASLLTAMVSYFPTKKEYWQQLSAVYSTLGNDSESLAVMQLAYLNNLLTEEKELVNLARFYMYMEMPYKAALLIEETMKKGAMESSRENLEMLYQAYLSANELEAAVDTLFRISDLSPDRDVLLKIAQLQAEMFRWDEANKTITKAISAGSPDNAGRAYLIQGITFYELNEQEKAVESFNHALQESETKKEAQQWLAFLRTNRIAIE
jgi:tetratricopeptide (TPR) repeat protein